MAAGPSPYLSTVTRCSCIPLVPESRAHYPTLRTSCSTIPAGWMRPTSSGSARRSESARKVCIQDIQRRPATGLADGARVENLLDHAGLLERIPSGGPTRWPLMTAEPAYHLSRPTTASKLRSCSTTNNPSPHLAKSTVRVINVDLHCSSGSGDHRFARALTQDA